MNKPLVIGAVLGVAVATTGGVVAGYRMLQDDEQQTVAQTTSVAEECHPTSDASDGPRDKNQIAGTAIGALVGGAVGRDVGDRDITTAAGAAAGALAGREIQQRMQEHQAEEAAQAPSAC
jgi:uncharacterized protein YcfJ